MTTRQYKDLKGLKKQNLRDKYVDYINLSLICWQKQLTKDIANTSNPQGLERK